MKYVFIGGAWPYANGPLHIGHAASLLPGDVLARFYRASGAQVIYVSGTDCHGTPVSIAAQQQGKTPREVSDGYHEAFSALFARLGFSYDLYTKTSSPAHIAFVRAFHKKMYESDLIYEKTAPQAFCPVCKKTLTDRQVVGTCPQCGAVSRGDQCDECDSVWEAEQLVKPVCAVCGGPIDFKESRQLYIALSRLEKPLTEYLAAHPDWRTNAVALTEKYIREGLRDRAVTRDLSWGIPVPKEGFTDKSIYIWAENILGYLSAARVAAERQNIDFDALWGPDAEHYYVHGKDNIPFHTIILPALLLANGHYPHLPDRIISSEHMTLEGRPISTSRGWGVWLGDIIGRFDPDVIRYYLIAAGPERKDADFTWREFFERNNSDLVGAYGNFVHRTLIFIHRFFDGKVPQGRLRLDVETQINAAFRRAGSALSRGLCRQPLEHIFSLVRFGNRFFDAEQPWITRGECPEACKDTLFNCVQLIAALAVLLSPFLPFSSHKLFHWLSLSPEWRPQLVPAGYSIPEVSVLFSRLAPEKDKS